MTSTTIPTEPITEDDSPHFPPGLVPDYQARRLRAIWDDIPAEYQAQLIAAARRLPPLDPELIAVAHEAERQGQIVRNHGAIELMQSWLAERKQGETWAMDQEELEITPLSLREWSP